MSEATAQPWAEDPSSECAALILAAGKSTRMRSRLPKPLHPLCGIPLTRHVIRACRLAGIARVVVVVGHEAEAVKAGLGDDVEYVFQKEQRGSGDAVRACYPLLKDYRGMTLVLAGDVPLLRPETLSTLIQHQKETGAAASLLTAFLDDATGYGRIVRGSDGSVEKIVEHRDATPEERAIKEWNPSIYCFQSQSLFAALQEVRSDNTQGEFYLTDVIGILRQHSQRVEAIPLPDSSEALGVNTRVELANVAAILRQRILHRLMLSGVTITDPATTYVDLDVQVGQDTTLEPQTFLHGQTVIGEGCTIGPFTRICDSLIGDNSVVVSSQIVRSQIGNGVRIGPFANVRPGCKLADHVKIGDFVELKNATLAERVSASHLSYIGDAEVGEETNIGAGVVTCNYDGIQKHRTIIGKRAFIGTHTTLIAPVSVGDGAFIAAGSPINQDVPEDSLAIAREKMSIKPDWAKRWREKKERFHAGR
jgi:bifunctional UDP-N-acetylglucosamine pyrophosphorylase/glucosamine-1-phosphate N-acetyltransferase